MITLLVIDATAPLWQSLVFYAVGVYIVIRGLYIFVKNNSEYFSVAWPTMLFFLVAMIVVQNKELTLLIALLTVFLNINTVKTFSVKVKATTDDGLLEKNLIKLKIILLSLLISIQISTFAYEEYVYKSCSLNKLSETFFSFITIFFITAILFPLLFGAMVYSLNKVEEASSINIVKNDK